MRRNLCLIIGFVGIVCFSFSGYCEARNHAHNYASSNIQQVWVNEGGDKVTRDELRATNDSNSVLNSVWDGQKVTLFGAKNEVVAFNLLLEAPTEQASNVNIAFDALTGYLPVAIFPFL